jgi:hypothetical protein
MSDFPRTRETTRTAADSAWTKSSLSHANGNCVQIADKFSA